MTEEVKTDAIEPEPKRLSAWRRALHRAQIWWRDSPPMDRWDRIGLVGLCLLSVGVRGLLGWWWAALVAGSLLLTLYYLGEIRAAAAPKKKG